MTLCPPENPPRAVRYACEKLGDKPGFFASLVKTVMELLGETFPDYILTAVPVIIGRKVGRIEGKTKITAVF